jgi:hypothetical protein
MNKGKVNGLFVFVEGVLGLDYIAFVSVVHSAI